MTLRIPLFTLAAFAVALAPASASAQSKPASTAPIKSAAVKPTSVARVNVTGQQYDFVRPWSQRPPHQRRALGPIVEGAFGRAILMTGEVVANASYVEVEQAESGEKAPASVLAVDYEANLALVQPNDPAFLKDLRPLALTESRVGDQLTIWQLESSGTLLSTGALLTAVDVTTYPTDESSLLIYRFTTALQPREGSFTAPVVRGGKLSGMIVRFDSRTQNADAIPAPVIEHFLKDAGKKEGYSGFPKAGFGFSALRDPQLRRYAGAPAGRTGVYITGVVPGGPAQKAGLQEGDVLLAVDGQEIDHDGNYDDRLYGKIAFTHILSTHHYAGDTIPLTLLRKGDKMSLGVTLETEDLSRRIIEPYMTDRAPSFYILGGLIFQELSRDYLKEWGAEWKKKAPDRFVYFDENQQELFKDEPRKRLVILSHVLPTPLTIGYEDLSSLVVTEVNGVSLKRLSDIEEALTKSPDGFHRIRFSEAPGEIALDAREVKAVEQNLMRGYGLPILKRLNPAPAPPLILKQAASGQGEGAAAKN